PQRHPAQIGAQVSLLLNNRRPAVAFPSGAQLHRTHTIGGMKYVALLAVLIIVAACSSSTPRQTGTAVPATPTPAAALGAGCASVVADEFVRQQSLSPGACFARSCCRPASASPGPTIRRTPTPSAAAQHRRSTTSTPAAAPSSRAS